MLPTSATDQRTQLARRLAAEDSSTDLMNLDPVFVAEFANAGWLASRSRARGRHEVRDDDVLAGAADTVSGRTRSSPLPLWANTQVLWFRKSLAEAAGLDMTQPVTWDRSSRPPRQRGHRRRPGQPLRGVCRVDQRAVQGAGGAILIRHRSGQRSRASTIDSEAGRAAAEVIEKLADSGAAQPDFTVSNEGTSLGQMFPAEGAGEFMTNWTFVYKNYEGRSASPAVPPTRSSSRTSAGRATRRPSRARRPSHRSAASTSGSAPSGPPRVRPWRRPSASPARRRRSTSR